MAIPIPTGRSYTSTLKVKAWIPVACEHCGCTFVYLVERTGVGRASAPLFLGMAGAKDRAQKGAVDALERALTRVDEAVPCVRCGRYQDAMVARLRRRRIRIGWWVAALPLLFWVLVVLSSIEVYGGFLKSLVSGDSLLTLAIACTPLVIGYTLASRLDPEAHAGRFKAEKIPRSEVTAEDYAAVKRAGYAIADRG